jgi:phosphoglycerate dehydrogenase-like enzyme
MDDSLEPLALRHPEWRFSYGGAPADAEYEVLAAGRPTLELLTASKRLHTLVIPFAGVPAQTAELLAEVPGIAVRTVHHTAGPTAELALGLVLAAARALIPADQAMRNGDWTPRFVPPRPTMLLAGHPALIVGYGEVGRRVARSLTALEMEVHAIRGSITTPYADGEVLVHPAGLDVWPTEATSTDPPPTNITASRFPFHTLPNVVLSPHRGGAFSLPESTPLRQSALEAALTNLAGGR